MSRATPDDQLKFLLCCVKHSNNGKIDFPEVANECGIVSKGAAAKRYERLMKANGIHPNGGPSPLSPYTPSSRPSQKVITKNSKPHGKKRKLDHGSAGYFRDDSDDEDPKPKNEAKLEAKQEQQMKPDPRMEFRQDMSLTQWKPMPPPVWNFKPETGWGTPPGPEWKPMPISTWESRLMMNHPSMRQEFQQPRHIPPPPNRYMMQTDDTGNSSVVLNNGCDSIFHDFCTNDICEQLQNLDRGPYQSPRTGQQVSYQSPGPAQQMDRLSFASPQAMRAQQAIPAPQNDQRTTMPSVPEEKKSMQSVEDSQIPEVRHTAQSMVQSMVDGPVVQSSPKPVQPISIIIAD